MTAIDEQARRAVAVLGPISATDLGFVLPHEHLTVDTRDLLIDGGDYPSDTPMSIQTLAQAKKWPRSIADNLVLDSDEAVRLDLSRFRRAGGATVVDLTPIGMGRDFARFRDLSTSTGVNVIASTGYYVTYGHKGRVAPRAQAALAAEMIAELEIGDGISRCGAIGEIGISAEPDLDEWKVLGAALAAQEATGAPIWIHVTTLRPVAALLDYLGARAQNPSQIVICHMDYSLEDLTLHRRAIAMGFNIEFDLFGFPGWNANNFIDLPTDTKRVRALLELSAEGAQEQLFVSHDVCMKMQLSSWGGYGYAHLLESVEPMFVQLAGSAELLLQFAVVNTRRVLCWDTATP